MTIDNIYILPDMPGWDVRPCVALVGSESDWQRGAAREVIKGARAVVRTDGHVPPGPQRAAMIQDVLRGVDVVMAWIDSKPGPDWLELAWFMGLRPRTTRVVWGAAKPDGDPEWEPGGHLRFLACQTGGVVHPTLEQTLAAVSETTRMMRGGVR
jgi:hypothetical protein